MEEAKLENINRVLEFLKPIDEPVTIGEIITKLNEVINKVNELIENNNSLLIQTY